MTWTVFEHRFGDNETDEDAPGRGGYSYVLVELAEPNAVEWFEETFEDDPSREVMPDPHDDPAWFEQAWDIEQYADEDDARRATGEMELEDGGIGVPMTRLYTWGELRSRLDVKVVAADEV